jgi:anti-sigma factor RsiW
MSAAADDIREAELHAHVDGRLPPERRAAMAAHLAASPEDATSVEAWRAQNEALRKAFEPVASEPVPLRLSLVRLDTRASSMAEGRWKMAMPAFAAGLVAGVVLTGLAWWHFRLQVVTEAQTVAHETLARRAFGAHRVFTAEVRYPVEVKAGEAHLAAWLQRRTTVPVRLPDLTAEGFNLLGGRLLPDGAEGSAALLMFEAKGGERLTLYLSKAANSEETSFRYEEKNGAGAFYWIDRNVAYVLAGPADRDRLLRLAKRVYDAFEGGGR